MEVVSDLTSESFIAALRRFVARRGTPVLIWSDNGTNFISANNELRRMYELLSQQDTERAVTDFCSCLGIEWRFIPEHAPHFGGLWEAAVKTHLRRIFGEVKLTFEELSRKRWSKEYLTTLNKFCKWKNPTRNLQVSDIVILKEDNLVLTKWPLARVSQVHCGQDGLVQVATMTTAKRTYKRPVIKLTPLLIDSD